MTVPKPQVGQLGWDVPLNAALDTLDSNIQAETARALAAEAALHATAPGSGAGLVTYDPTTSAGDSGTPIPAYTVQDALDFLHRDITDRDEQTYLVTKRDTLRSVYALNGAAPQATVDGTVPGFAPMDASRLVPRANLGTGTPDGTKFLRGDGVWGSPSATAVRTWEREPGDQNLKAMVADPNAFQNTATLTVASTLYLFRAWLQANVAVTNYVVHCQTVGATLTASTFAFALFNTDATGTLVANSGTADAASVWTTTGMRTIALTSPFTPSTAGWYLIGVQIGAGTTMPKVSTGAAHALANIGLAQGTNVAPNSASCPLYGTATNVFSGLTPPATTGNVIDGGGTLTFFAGLS